MENKKIPPQSKKKQVIPWQQYPLLTELNYYEKNTMKKSGQKIKFQQSGVGQK